MSRRGISRSDQAAARGRRAGARPRPGATSHRWSRLASRPAAWLLLLGAVAAVVIVGVLAVGLVDGSHRGAEGTTVQARGGHWTNITADRLATMLTDKDFVLLNVKTPYSGEIAGTDLYIPYDQIVTRAGQLPSDKSARLVVYCRSGHESAIAAQSLLDLGFTNIANLDGGMTAWTASGRQLISVDRGTN